MSFPAARAALTAAFCAAIKFTLELMPAERLPVENIWKCGCFSRNDAVEKEPPIGE
jgi:hypothetical protein